MKHRSHRSEKERRIRSRLHALIGEKEMIRASILTLETRCGKQNCKCAKGQKHKSTVVEQSRKGETRMRTVPPAQRNDIEDWVKNWREVRNLLEELSEIGWQKLEKRKKK